ncbi:hypothetical protein GCM10011608_09730 [Micromonospora sonchi]|uniref:Uncharacterized protein n=1 Tax=Micromonospora sonchi TaxID=1763543 RepID=A0A917TN42_9ACTN|nr:DUF6221 family protein [Micromonospora sonchi]GGM26968.1 hypothetical protein GCM10011608_09730 [Micromonospora sonchi]
MTHELVTWLVGVLDRIEQQAPEVHAASCPAVDSSGMLYAVSLDACSCGWPQRIRTDIAAKRNILGLVVDSGPGWHDGYTEAYRDVVRLLAAPFAAEPGYRAEWGPQ